MVDSDTRPSGTTPAPASQERGEIVAAPFDLLCSLPARAASGLVWVYQKTVSPALVVLDPTGGCRFAPTCSHYARGALAEHGFIVGTGLTLRRLSKCGPWHPGGEDPVPLKDHATTGSQDDRLAQTRPPTCISIRRPSSVVPSPLSHG